MSPEGPIEVSGGATRYEYFLEADKPTTRTHLPFLDKQGYTWNSYLWEVDPVPRTHDWVGCRINPTTSENGWPEPESEFQDLEIIVFDKNGISDRRLFQGSRTKQTRLNFISSNSGYFRIENPDKGVTFTVEQGSIRVMDDQVDVH